MHRACPPDWSGSSGWGCPCRTPAPAGGCTDCQPKTWSPSGRYLLRQGRGQIHKGGVTAKARQEETKAKDKALMVLLSHYNLPHMPQLIRITQNPQKKSTWHTFSNACWMNHRDFLSLDVTVRTAHACVYNQTLQQPVSMEWCPSVLYCTSLLQYFSLPARRPKLSSTSGHHVCVSPVSYNQGREPRSANARVVYLWNSSQLLL